MEELAAPTRFHVFISYSSDDGEEAVALAERLRHAGLRVWQDKEELRPGLSWQQGILDGLDRSDSCIVVIGDGGVGTWHRKELEAALLKQGPDFPVIPVLLPGAPDRTEIDAFLSSLTWVDFHRGLDDSEALARLIWGITGVRPAAAPFVERASVAWFRIETPEDGDLLEEGSSISGTGPPNVDVHLHSRMRGEDGYRSAAWREADDSGRWSFTALEVVASEPLEGYRSGAYEFYVADQDGGLASQMVTAFYRDSGGIRKAVGTLRQGHAGLEVSYELRTAYLERTKLRSGKMVSSGRLSGSITEAEELAATLGAEAATALQGLVSRDELAVTVAIDAEGRIQLDPSAAWVSYYAFPVDRDWMFWSPPSTSLDHLHGMRMTQMAWRLTSDVGEIPAKPFGDGWAARNAYLEVRHDGYRPEFVPLEHIEAQTFEVVLAPVLDKRVAVLDFPPLDAETTIPGLSQLILREVLAAVERKPELATFGVFSSDPPEDEGSDDIFVQMGRPSIEIHNEVLGPEAVRDIEEQLSELDNPVVSGEGRFVQRKMLDVQYVIRGSYRLLSA